MEEDLYDTPWEFKNKTFAENIAVIEAATANTSNLIIPTKISSKHSNNKRISESNSLSISSSTNSSPTLNNNEKKFSIKITKENFDNNCFIDDIKLKKDTDKGSPRNYEQKLNNDTINCNNSKNILATVVPVNIDKDTQKIFCNNHNISSKNSNKKDDCKKDKISNRIDYKLAIDNGTCLLKEDLKYGNHHSSNIQRKQETSNDNKLLTSINSNPSSPFEVVLITTRPSSTSPLNNQSPKATIKEKSSPLSRHTTILTTKPSSPKHHKQPTSYHRSSHSDTIDIPNLENTCNNQPSFNVQGQKSSTNKYHSHLIKKNKIDTEDMIIHNNVDRTIAEMILQNKDTGYFLLRKRSEGSMAMSLKGNSGILHIKLEQRSGKWILGEGPTFSSISSVIKYYRNHELPIRGADHIILRNPILVQMDDGKFFC
ncbi:SH2 domain-containing protein [Strongyloides ratti]|uniref:SH2 domain-containing protein n=1 Tax=Strongyloides ratti TaxID=34506 RepID=A0A090MXH1_STRRB|nr:SH2 domain-containing protein [Strongyloides ratti]CEF65424.1 SH2 domain-containing protein [Strongyloides ratti]